MNRSALTHKDIFTVAIPIMLSNITTPLIGVVDMAVLGQSEEVHLIGAVGIGAQIFAMVFWAFGFLRMGTTGFAAQADGNNDETEAFAVLVRALIIAGLAGLFLWCMQVPIALTAFYLIPGSGIVEEAARDYYDIRIWSAPATLANYAILGWFIGRGRADIALCIQLLLNCLNIAFDAWFVLELDMGVRGVAYGSVLAEVIAVIAGLAVSLYILKDAIGPELWRRVSQVGAITRMMAVNGDIMARTLCLLFAFAFLTAQSAGLDDQTLAANSVLLGFLSISAYFLDGFAYAAERFVGHAIGAGNKERFRQAFYVSSLWALIMACGVSAVYAVFGTQIIEIITVSPAIRELAGEYLIWAIAAPVIGVACFQLDGVFIGATQTRDMRNMMILSLGIYLISWKILTPLFGNHGLWAAFMIFFVARGATLAWRFPVLEKTLFTPSRQTVPVK